MHETNHRRFVIQDEESKEQLAELGISLQDQTAAFEQLNNGLERIAKTQRAEKIGAEALLAIYLNEQ